MIIKLDITDKIKLNEKAIIPPDAIKKESFDCNKDCYECESYKNCKEYFTFPWTFKATDLFQKIKIVNQNTRGDSIEIALKGRENITIYVYIDGNIYVNNRLSKMTTQKEITELVQEIPNMWEEGMIVVKEQDAMLKETIDLLPRWGIYYTEEDREALFSLMKQNNAKKHTENLCETIRSIKKEYEVSNVKWDSWRMKCSWSQIEKSLKAEWYGELENPKPMIHAGGYSWYKVGDKRKREIRNTEENNKFLELSRRLEKIPEHEVNILKTAAVILVTLSHRYDKGYCEDEERVKQQVKEYTAFSRERRTCIIGEDNNKTIEEYRNHLDYVEKHLMDRWGSG